MVCVSKYIYLYPKSHSSYMYLWVTVFILWKDMIKMKAHFFSVLKKHFIYFKMHMLLKAQYIYIYIVTAN